MALPLLAILFAGALGIKAGVKHKRRSNQETSFNNALASLTAQPGGGQQGGTTNAAFLSPEQAEGLQHMFQANQQAGTQLLGQMMTRNFNANQNALSREVSWANTDQARDTFRLNIAKFENTVSQQILAAENRTEDLAIAFRNRKEIAVIDPATNQVTIQPQAGTKENRELLNRHDKMSDLMNLSSAYLDNLMQNGMIFDPEQANFDTQRSMQTSLLFAVKEAEAAGALDQGMIDAVGGLITQSTSAEAAILGNDAGHIERFATTVATNFMPKYQQASANTRLLPGITESFASKTLQSETSATQVMSRVPPLLQQLRQSPTQNVRIGATPGQEARVASRLTALDPLSAGILGAGTVLEGAQSLTERFTSMLLSPPSPPQSQVFRGQVQR